MFISEKKTVSLLFSIFLIDTLVKKSFHVHSP